MWNQLSKKNIESFKQGQVSMELKLKRQQNAVGLTGDIIKYDSYSQGMFLKQMLETTQTKTAKVTRKWQDKRSAEK